MTQTIKKKGGNKQIKWNKEGGGNTRNGQESSRLFEGHVTEATCKLNDDVDPLRGKGHEGRRSFEVGARRTNPSG